MGLTKRGIKVLFLAVLTAFYGCHTAQKARRPSAVSLVPSVTETIFAMHAEDHLVGVSDFCDYPPEARKLPHVGSLLSPSYERIVELTPDIVFVTLPMQKEVKRNLEKLGLKTADISPESISEILNSIVEVGTLLDETEKALRLRDSLKTEYEKLLKTIPTDGETLKVYVELSGRPLYTAGKNSFISEYLSVIGWRNAFDDVEQPYFAVNDEEVVKRNPQVIILLYKNGNPEEVRKRLGWSDIDAVRNGRIFVVSDLDVFLRPGPRFLDAIKWLVEIKSELRNRERGRG